MLVQVHKVAVEQVEQLFVLIFMDMLISLIYSFHAEYICHKIIYTQIIYDCTLYKTFKPKINEQMKNNGTQIELTKRLKLSNFINKTYLGSRTDAINGWISQKLI